MTMHKVVQAVHTEMSQKRRFAVVGAGAAGLCAAKYLTESGFDVTVYEIGSKVGGLWCFRNDSNRSAAYRTLHINTAKHLTNFTDFPFDADVQMFPNHEDMYRYLHAYARRYGILDKIRFNARVERIAPSAHYTAANPSWIVEAADGSSELYDRVVVATGHLSEPLHVEQFRGSFEGEYLHSHDYLEPEPFVGKRVCVVGIGNSALDISSDICMTAAKTVIVARSGIMIQPKMIFGMPFTDVTFKLYKWWIPTWLRQLLINALVSVVHGRMTKFGFLPMTKKVHTTSSPVFVQHVAYNRILVKHGIEKIDGRTIRFTDGSSDEFDVIIGATGYLIDLPFLDRSIVPVVNNSVELYRRIVSPEWPGLYFMGFLNSTTALNLTFEHQARWICSLERNIISLPDAASMREAIKKKQDWIARVYKASLRHTIEEEHVSYFNEIRVPNAKAHFGRDLPT